jgi:hypothetical protein
MRTIYFGAVVLRVHAFGSAGCSDSNPTVVDAPRAIDAYDTARCLIKGNYGALGAITGTAAMAGTAPTLTFVLDPGPPGKDDLFFKLVSGKGAFAGGIMPGTYTIAGADGAYGMCGLCGNVIADIIPGTGPSKFYQLDSGTVTFTRTAAPFAGSGMNLHYAEVDISSGMKIAGGCEATITSVMFSTP